MNRSGSKNSRYRGRLSAVSPEGASSRLSRKTAANGTRTGLSSEEQRQERYPIASELAFLWGFVLRRLPCGNLTRRHDSHEKEPGLYTVRETPFLPPKGRENALHNHVVPSETSLRRNRPEPQTNLTTQPYGSPRFPVSLSTDRPEGADTVWPSPEAEVPVPNDVPVFPLALFHPGDFSRGPRRTALTSVSDVAGAPLRAPHRVDTWVA